ncbi:hypothetical protein [Kribbella shirazensis]|uniref:Uncharacterized protein n=1 Tax=Kribbella shirazensis TaxID=1105143 RepID=A0A7X5VF94_9ACTN|nr:hypothetical protein [Kribbella shirazensis]NIK59228.1 hypothetical protein [Kribbella shirazensis]
MPTSRWVSVLGVFALVATILGLVALLDIRHQRAVAQDFLDTGVEMIADQVEVAVWYGRGGDYVDEVEVTFVVATKRVVATLSNSLGDPEGNAEGRHPPAAGTRYAAPLRIVYKPEDPSQVMALVDAEEFAADSATPAGVAGIVTIGGTTTVAIAVGRLAQWRLLSGRVDRAERRRVGRPRGTGDGSTGRHRRADG